MFSVRQKREIADGVQKLLRATNHPELPEGEISFTLNVSGATPLSWATIKNNGAVRHPEINPHNEAQDRWSCPSCQSIGFAPKQGTRASGEVFDGCTFCTHEDTEPGVI